MLFKVGSKVEHPIYGSGVIFHIDEAKKKYLMKAQDGFHHVKESELCHVGFIKHADEKKSTEAEIVPSTPKAIHKRSLVSEKCPYTSGDTIYHDTYGQGMVTVVSKQYDYIRVKFKYNTIRYFRHNDKQLSKTPTGDNKTSNRGLKNTVKSSCKSKEDNRWKYKVGDIIYNARLGEGKVTQIMRSLEAYTVKFGTKAFFMRLDGSIPDLEKESLKITNEPSVNNEQETHTTTIATSDGLIYEGTTVVSFSEEELRSCVVLDALCTSIGEYAFSYCEPLCSIVIPASVKSIGDGAFSGCSSLTLLVLKGRITEFGSEAFADCKAGVVIMCFEKDVDYYKSKIQLTEPRFIPFNADEKKDSEGGANSINVSNNCIDDLKKTKQERPIYSPPKYMRDDDVDDAKSDNRAHTSFIDWLSSNDDFDEDKTATSNNEVNNKTTEESSSSDVHTQSDNDETTIRFGSDRINFNSEQNKEESTTDNEEYSDKQHDTEELDTGIKINDPVFQDDSIDEQYFAPIQNLDKVNIDGNSKIETIYNRELKALSDEAQTILKEHFPIYSQIEDIQEGGYYPDFSEFTEDFMICNELEKFCDHMSFLVQGIKVGQ